MKKTTGILFLIISNYTFANFFSLSPQSNAKNLTRQGSGKWKEQRSQKKGKYSIQLKIKHTENGLRLTETYKIKKENTQFTSDLLLKKDALGFVTIYNYSENKNTTPIGSGVCFKKALRKKVCQLSYQTEGTHVVKTYLISHGYTKRIGTVYNDHISLAFTDLILGSFE